MSRSANVLITGDTFLGGGRVEELARQKNLESLFSDYLSIIQEADLAITNLASPIINEGSPIAKTGPNLKSPDETVSVLKDAGFDLVTLANNHIMDYGDDGLENTLNICRAAGLNTVGAGMGQDSIAKPYITEIDGITIAIVNIAENEFGTSQNGEPGGHGMDPVQNYYSIRQAKDNSDVVIVIVHGGHEHYELPSPRMKKTYRFYADAGADAVVGHHTHCISGNERYHDVPIFYSLGNFLFDKNSGEKLTDWNRGVMCILDIAPGKPVDFELKPYIQGWNTGGLQAPDKKEEDAINSHIDSLNKIIDNDEALEKSFGEYCERSKRLYNSYIEPHSIRIVHALRNRQLMPPLLSKRKKLLYNNLVRCEAHRDVLLNTLTS
jgi:poly-gamma-glutamate synthesis protein (capsule biosynthesis protein)